MEEPQFLFEAVLIAKQYISEGSKYSSDCPQNGNYYRLFGCQIKLRSILCLSSKNEGRHDLYLCQLSLVRGLFT